MAPLPSQWQLQNPGSRTLGGSNAGHLRTMPSLGAGQQIVIEIVQHPPEVIVILQDPLNSSMSANSLKRNGTC